MPVEPHQAYQRPAIEFKSVTLTMPVLNIADTDLGVITEQLKIKLKQAPEFFRNSPLLLDLHEIRAEQEQLDLGALISAIQDLGLLPVGIRGATEQQKKTALQQHMAVLPDHRGSGNKPAPALKPEVPKEELSVTEKTQLITQPIRSGQRIYAKKDLIVLAQVSAGAEIMAEGNIHIYGTLRGRALAGVQGDSEARIFCADLQAELISIAGHYRISEDLQQADRGRPVQIHLQDQALIINPI